MNKKSKKKILYIDGDERYRNRVKNAFNNNSYQCILCSKGIEGLDYIVREKPHIVIVDYFLPDISGDEVYTRFLTEPRFRSMRDIPFIVITNNGKVDKSHLYGMGFSACLGKPFRSKELMEFVEDVFVSHQLRVEEFGFWETIREAKDFLESVIESSADAIVTTNNRGIITYCNRAGEEILQYSFDELVGKRVNQFLEKGSSELLRINAFLRKRNRLQNYRTVVIDKEGRRTHVNLSISTMKNSNGRVMGALGIIKKVGRDSFIEYSRNDSERIAAVVETAVAVNHAINNPLVPILGNAQVLLQDEHLVDENVRRRLRVIVKNALRIRDFTQKLASISHPVTKEYLKGTRMLDIEASA